MGWDIAVYSPEPMLIAPEEIVKALQTRGIALKWTPSSATETTRLSGYFEPAGESDPPNLVSASSEVLDEVARAGLLDAYKAKTTENERQKLTLAQIEYMLSTGFSPSIAWRRVFLNLVDVIAELGDGLILDTSKNQFHDRAAFRQTHPEVTT